MIPFKKFLMLVVAPSMGTNGVVTKHIGVYYCINVFALT